MNVRIVVKNKFVLDASDIEFESPSFRLIKKKLKTLKQGDGEFVILKKDPEFIQTYLSKVTDGIRYYHVEYKLDNSNIINIAKDALTEQQVIQAFYKFYKYDQSFITDTIWDKQKLPEIKTP